MGRSSHGAGSVTVSICTSRTALLRLALLQVLVVIDVFLGDRVNLSKKYDYPRSRSSSSARWALMSLNSTR